MTLRRPPRQPRGARVGMAPRARVATYLLAGGALLAIGVAPRRADAVATVEHEPGGDACAQAATYFPEDESDPARRARLSCRREVFARQMDEDRQYEEAQTEEAHDKILDTWMQRQNIPARMLRRNAVDLFGGGGLMTYGIAGGWLLLPELEAELWFGRRNVSDSISTGYLRDSRSCIGARLKWLIRSRGNLTPFLSGGAADCWANVAFQSSGTFSPDGTFTPPAGESFGTAAAHVVTGSAGLAWMEKSGLRASVEYGYTYAFYTQATLMDDARTMDGALRTAWTDRLTSDRGGVRLQVGYAF